MAESFFMERIKEAYPELIITSVVWNRNGQNNDVFIVNDEFVFRFPKYQEGILALEKEGMLLRYIKPYLTLPIPQPLFEQFERKSVGYAFSGYAMLAGQPFFRKCYQSIEKQDEQACLVKQLGCFLRELHHTPLSPSILEKWDKPDMESTIGDLYSRIQEKLYSFLSKDTRQEISNRFETYLGEPAHFRFEPCLIHGDFGSANILYQPEQFAISGIIDFGNGGLGDPAYDLAGLFSSYGYGCIELLSRVYPLHHELLERMNFYQSTFALQEALFGLEHQDQQAFQAGIAPYMDSSNGAISKA
ncbi:MAG TPA: aminoglycoside phosphotransferase family protein [Brevibacillus sp.]|nr:aminoglycoside phosphotransferase family protein [Brevibacillus sp.]